MYVCNVYMLNVDWVMYAEFDGIVCMFEWYVITCMPHAYDHVVGLCMLTLNFHCLVMNLGNALYVL